MKKENLIFAMLASGAMLIGERCELGIKNPYMVGTATKEHKYLLPGTKFIFPMRAEDASEDKPLGKNKDFIVYAQNIFGEFLEIPQWIINMYTECNSTIKKASLSDIQKIGNVINFEKH